MKLREALITQSPSLELQRAAQNEISKLDSRLAESLFLLQRLVEFVPPDLRVEISEFTVKAKVHVSQR